MKKIFLGNIFYFIFKGWKYSRVIKTRTRNVTILRSFVGITFLIHNGNSYRKVLITAGMVGKKLGEFSHTRQLGNTTSSFAILKKGAKKKKKK